MTNLLDAAQALTELMNAQRQTKRLLRMSFPHQDAPAGAMLVANRLELVIARDHAVLLAFDVDVIKRGGEAPAIDALAQFVKVERDRHRGFVFTVDNARHFAGATFSPGGPLAALRTRNRLEFHDGRHCLKSLICQKLKAARRPREHAAASWPDADVLMSRARRVKLPR
mgnify:CR=1 FL=1